MRSHEGHAWVSMVGVGHVELSEGFFALIDRPKKICFLMKNIKNPKYLMAKSINPILARGLIYPCVKICFAV